MIINLGCGKTKIPGVVGVDSVYIEGYTDIVHNLENTPYPFDDSSVDEVHFYHVLEHLENPLKKIEEIHRVLKNEGLFFGKLFGYKTSGYKNANILELNTFSNIKEGPLGGNKIAFIFNHKLIKRLFKSFIILSIDEIIRTNNNGNSTIHEYLVVVKKV
jgi:ubiquinone/menaquinone biosynthesis C-methylase UbiE